MEYILQQIEPENPSPLVICLDKDEIVVGRKTFPALLKYNLVSRRHASFQRIDGQWLIKDLGSLNCLYVNARKLNGTQKLRIGDTIGFGIPYHSVSGGFLCVFKFKQNIKQEIINVSDHEPNSDKLHDTYNSSKVVKDDINVLKDVTDTASNKIMSITNLPSGSVKPPFLQEIPLNQIHLDKEIIPQVLRFTEAGKEICSTNNILPLAEDCSVYNPSFQIFPTRPNPLSGVYNSLLQFEKNIQNITINNKLNVENSFHSILNKTIKSEIDLIPSEIIPIKQKVKPDACKNTDSTVDASNAKNEVKQNNLKPVLVEDFSKSSPDNEDITTNSKIHNSSTFFPQNTNETTNLSDIETKEINICKDKTQKTNSCCDNSISKVSNYQENLVVSTSFSDEKIKYLTKHFKLKECSVTLPESDFVQSFSKELNVAKALNEVSKSTHPCNNLFKECYVLLERCDSKNYKLPSDVKCISKCFQSTSAKNKCKRNIKKKPHENKSNNCGSFTKKKLKLSTDSRLLKNNFCIFSTKAFKTNSQKLKKSLVSQKIHKVSSKSFHQNVDSKTPIILKSNNNNTESALKFTKSVSNLKPAHSLIDVNDNLTVKSPKCFNQVLTSANQHNEIGGTKITKSNGTKLSDLKNKKLKKQHLNQNKNDSCKHASQEKYNDFLQTKSIFPRSTNPILTVKAHSKQFPKRNWSDSLKKGRKGFKTNSQKLKKSLVTQKIEKVSSKPLHQNVDFKTPVILKSNGSNSIKSTLKFTKCVTNLKPADVKDNLSAKSSKCFNQFLTVTNQHNEIRGTKNNKSNVTKLSALKNKKLKKQHLNKNKNDSCKQASQEKYNDFLQIKSNYRRSTNPISTVKLFSKQIPIRNRPDPSNSTSKNQRKYKFPRIPGRFSSRMNFLLESSEWNTNAPPRTLNNSLSMRREGLSRNNHLNENSSVELIESNQVNFSADTFPQTDFSNNSVLKKNLQNRVPVSTRHLKYDAFSFFSNLENQKRKQKKLVSNQFNFFKNKPFEPVTSNNYYQRHPVNIASTSQSLPAIFESSKILATESNIPRLELPNQMNFPFSTNNCYQRNPVNIASTSQPLPKIFDSSEIRAAVPNIPRFELPNQMNFPLSTNQSSGLGSFIEQNIPRFELPNQMNFPLSTNQSSGLGSFTEQNIPRFELPNQMNFPLSTNQPSGLGSFSVPSRHNIELERIPENFDNSLLFNTTKEPYLQQRHIAIVEPFSCSVDENSLSNEVRFSNNYNSLLFIQKIVEWNPKWLTDNENNLFPIVVNRNAHLHLSFDCYDSYFSAFSAAAVLDVWQHLTIENSKLTHELNLCREFYCIVTSCFEKNEMTEIECHSYVKNCSSYIPQEGDIIVLDIQDEEREVSTQVFGYIIKQKISKISHKQNNEHSTVSNAECWNLNIYTKSQISLENQTICFAHGLCNIKNKLQAVNALCTFQFSPFKNLILKPMEEYFFLSEHPFGNQTHFINAVKNEILSCNSPKKIFLLNGAPGTGKTWSILKLMEKLLFFNASKVKILVSAKDDSVIDEIGLRLLELNECRNWKSKSVKFIRIGESKKVHPKIQPFLLDKMVGKMCKSNCRKDLHTENELNRLKTKINELYIDVGSNPSFEKLDRFQALNEQFRTLKDQYKKDLNKLSQAQTQVCGCSEPSCSHLYCSLHESCIQYKASLLEESEVILSTLDDCIQCVVNLMAFQNNTEPFTCCIVDSAEQCSELEMLQCLTLGINKLVLVGDVLPETTKLIQKPQSTEHNRSMFKRFYKLFNKFRLENPINTLKEQFRMHSEIAHFPSKYFYNFSLLTSPETNERYRLFSLRPYFVLDVIEDQYLDLSSSEVKDSDQLVLTYLSSFIKQIVPSASVGVISTKSKVPMYNISLAQNILCKDVEVNSLDFYHSKEKDVVIVSCVRANDDNELSDFAKCETQMKMALTRARQSLIIYGHITSLTGHHHWNALLEDAKSRNLYASVSSLIHIPLITKEVIMKPA